MDRHDLTGPDWQAAFPRLKALQRLHLKTLPTARLVRWSYFVGGGLVVVAIIFWWAVGVAPAAMVGVVAILEFLLGHGRAQSIETGNLPGGRLQLLFDSRPADTADSAVQLVTAILDKKPADAVRTAAEALIPSTVHRFGAWHRRATKRMTNSLAAPLDPEERPLVAVPAILAFDAGLDMGVVTRRRDRLIFRIFSWVEKVRSMRLGVLTVTDRRVLFSYRATRWSDRRLLLDEPVADVEVLEWFKGHRITDRFQSILILRRSYRDDAEIRFNRVTSRAQAQLVFELVASISRRPPPALAAYWRHGGVPRDISRTIAP